VPPLTGRDDGDEKLRILIVMKPAIFVALALCALVPAAAWTQCSLDTVLTKGEATYYYATGGGSCMFDASPENLMVAAMNIYDYDTAGVCGECIELNGPDGAVKVRIVDLCPGCQSGDIDLSREAFSLIADTIRGRVPITWKVVECEVTGPIQYHFKDGSNQWWTAVQIRNSRHPVRSVEYQAGTAPFKQVNRVNYNYFVESGGMGPGPYNFRVTDIYGHVLVDNGIVFVENGTVPGAEQFPSCGAPATGVIDGEVPIGFWLSQNYPNPWNPQTTIRYGLPTAETVTLTVYDAAGREVEVLVNEHQHSGEHEVVFRAGNVASGVYYYTLRAGAFTETRRLVLLR
jgi:expansin (peptidoglycan-binding protein)